MIDFSHIQLPWQTVMLLLVAGLINPRILAGVGLVTLLAMYVGGQL